MNERLWSDEEIDAFLQRTLGKENLPTDVKERAIKYARAAIHIMRDGLEEVFALQEELESGKESRP